jgi:DNA-binding transcriptional LysR family regulator
VSHYRQMAIFEAVVQAQSFAAAARQLQVAPVTIMRTIDALETRLQTRLLIRGPRGVALSQAGERFALSCRQILEQIDLAERSAAGLHASPAGRLVVSLPLLVDQQLFMPIALAYLTAYPDVQLTTRTSQGLPKLLEEGIDVALVVGQLPSSSGFAMPVGAVRPVICEVGPPADARSAKGAPRGSDHRHRPGQRMAVQRRARYARGETCACAYLHDPARGHPCGYAGDWAGTLHGP